MQPRILIAEDDQLQGQILHDVLRQSGYQADLVGNGVEAVRRLATERYDVALLDYQLPDLDGLSAADLVRDLLRAEHRPQMIALTAAADGLRESEQGAQRPSFDAIIAKKQGLEIVLAVVAERLAQVAVMRAQAEIERRAQEIKDYRRQALRRFAARFCFVPPLCVLALFLLGIVGATNTIDTTRKTLQSAEVTVEVGRTTGALLAAVEDAEFSERHFAATRSPADLAEFEARLSHIDRLLISPAKARAGGLPGFNPDDAAVGTITQRVRSMAEHAEMLAPLDADATAPVSAPQPEREAINSLRGWVARSIAESQRGVAGGLDEISFDVHRLTYVLIAGAVFAAWLSGLAIWRGWRAGRGIRVMLNPSSTLRPQRNGDAVRESQTIPSGTSAICIR
jgi:CheY-like chemotaxis protein